MSDTEHLPTDVACAIYDASQHLMADRSWCINAAAIATHVLRALGVKGWPVQCTVLHANAAYATIMGTPAEESLPPWWEAEPGDPYCVWAQAMTQTKARTDASQLDANARSGHEGLPGHVLTWVPEWRAWLDPSAEQFTKREHGILLAPCAWPDAQGPPRGDSWKRPDDGLTGIMPTSVRGFATTRAWARRGDDHTRMLAREALRLLRENHPNGGRGDLRIPGIL